jgi:methyl-accepting chemotaxis protein
MRISTKLSVFYVAVLTVFCALSFALMSQLRTVVAGYDALLNSAVVQMDAARVVQVDFKKQVQEWKDILLRGHTPADLAKYTAQFHEKESAVKSGAQALALEVRDPEAKSLLVQFLAADSVLSAKYQESYGVYTASRFDFRAADKLVRGQDRPPTDLFDQVVKRLDICVKAAVESQRAAVIRSRNLTLAVAGALLLLLGVFGFVIVRDVLSRLGRLKAVSDRLAVADISGLVIDISGKDEIGAFGGSMKGVHAAIEELLSVAAAASPATKT